LETIAVWIARGRGSEAAGPEARAAWRAEAYSDSTLSTASKRNEVDSALSRLAAVLCERGGLVGASCAQFGGYGCLVEARRPGGAAKIAEKRTFGSEKAAIAGMATDLRSPDTVSTIEPSTRQKQRRPLPGAWITSLGCRNCVRRQSLLGELPYR